MQGQIGLLGRERDIPQWLPVVSVGVPAKWNLVNQHAFADDLLITRRQMLSNQRADAIDFAAASER
jgi:hypothetical protein